MVRIRRGNAWLRDSVRPVLMLSVTVAVYALNQHARHWDRAIDGSGGAVRTNVRVCFSQEPPFAFMQGATFTGTEVELLRDVLGNVTLVPVPTPFAKLIPAVRARACDVIANGMFVMPSRCPLVLFSEPTIVVERGLLRTPMAINEGIDSYEKIAASSQAVVAVVGGGVSYQSALRAKVPEARLLAVATLEDAVIALREGRAQLVGGSRPALQYFCASVDEAGVVTLAGKEPSITAYGAFAFNPNDRLLRDRVNARLRVAMTSSRHLALLGQFGLQESNPDAGTTTDLLCSDGALVP